MSRSIEKLEELIDTEYLCQVLKFKKSYIYLLTHEKRIPHYKVQGHLRFRLSEIEDWLAGQYIGAEDINKVIDF